MNKLTYRLNNFINNLTVTAKVLLNLWEDLSDNERYHQFNIIVRFSDKLNYSVNDISFLIKNTAQTTSLNCSKINLAELINEVVAQSKIFYLNNGLWINKEIANNIDYTILIDKKMISKVLKKLIAYSVNHSVSPNILISLKKVNYFFQISIQNQGLEIKDIDTRDLFVPFESNSSSSNNDIGDLDIDLAVCKKIIKAYNGKIWVENTSDKGTTFYFTLPC